MVKAIAICALLIAVSMVSGCGDKHQLAACRGGLVQANVGHWVPAPEDLR